MKNDFTLEQFLEAIDENPNPPMNSIWRRWWYFHHDHPEVYIYLLSLCFELRRKGFERYGIRSLWERVRWHFQVEKDLGADFKLNDHFHSRYVRLLLFEHPELEGFFEMRELKAA